MQSLLSLQFLTSHLNKTGAEHFKMTFFVLFFVLVLSTVVVKSFSHLIRQTPKHAQSATDAVVAPSPEDEISKIQKRGLVILEIRILTANLPDDLKEKAFDILLNAQIQLDACKSALEINLIIWQYKVCVISQLKIANIAVTQLEVQASGRQATNNAATTL